jgi:hypothetical protein
MQCVFFLRGKIRYIKRQSLQEDLEKQQNYKEDLKKQKNYKMVQLDLNDVDDEQEVLPARRRYSSHDALDRTESL